MSMRLAVNAGFGSPIGKADLALIAGLFPWGVRQDIRPDSDFPVLLDELAEAKLGAVLVLDRAVWRYADAIKLGCERRGIDAYYEAGNELDGKLGAMNYAFSVRNLYEILGDRLITAGITSTHERGLSWLAAVVEAGIPDDVILGYHTYRSGPPEQGLIHPLNAPLYVDNAREREFAWLKAIARGRRIACTETGYTYARTSWWPCRKPLSEDTVAEWLKREIALNEAAGAELCVVYQWQDSAHASRDPQDNMGIRRRDGTLRPAAYCALGGNR